MLLEHSSFRRKSTSTVASASKKLLGVASCDQRHMHATLAFMFVLRQKWLPYMAKLSGASTFCLFGQDAKISLPQIILGSDYRGSVKELLLSVRDKTFERNLVGRRITTLPIFWK